MARRRLPLIAALVLAMHAAPAAADILTDRRDAQRLIAARDWSAAAAAYRSITARSPDRGADWYFLAVALGQAGDCDAAAPALDRAIALGGTGSVNSLRRLRIDAAACALKRGDAPGALAHLRIAQGRLGFNDFAGLDRDPRFTALTADPAFRALAGQVGTSDRISGWRSDLAWYVDLVERRHPAPFHTLSAEDWRAAVRRLDADIPQLSDLAITGRFMQLAALIGDGHTGIYPRTEGEQAFHLLSILPYAFNGDWYVLAAAPEHAGLVGGRIAAINGQPTAGAMARMTRVLARDNSQTLVWLGALGLQFSEFAALDDPAADPLVVTLDIEAPDGARSTVRLPGEPIRRDPTGPWVPEGWPSIGGDVPAPLWLSRVGEPFWAESLAPGVLYVQINQIRNGEQQTFPQFAQALERRIREEGVRQVVIDLRHNNGGSGALNGALARALIRSDLNPENGLFVIVGRRTFSAAMNLASLLEQSVGAVFVGEPTGSRPNFYGEDTPFTLPWSRLTGSVSSAWFQGGATSFDERPWIAPDIAAPLTPDDLRQGRDPALEAIRPHLVAVERPTS